MIYIQNELWAQSNKSVNEKWQISKKHDKLFTILTNDREWCKTQRFFPEDLFDEYEQRD